MEQVYSNDGTLISYMKKGSGPPLLLVHGTTADHTRWSPISPQLEQYFTVWAMDRRGRGESSDSPHYDLMREAEDIATVVKAIGETAYVLGHSYGAVCCLEAALLTNQVRRLILYEPPIPTSVAQYSPGTPERMEALIEKGDLEAALEVFFREIVRMPQQELEAFRQLPVWKTRISLAPTIPREVVLDRSYNFNPDKFTHFLVPTLLLLGGESPPIFQQAIELLNSKLPTSKVVTLSGQQHVAMDTNPELFVSEVLQFLSEQ